MGRMVTVLKDMSLFGNGNSNAANLVGGMEGPGKSIQQQLKETKVGNPKKIAAFNYEHGRFYGAICGKDSVWKLEDIIAWFTQENFSGKLKGIDSFIIGSPKGGLIDLKKFREPVELELDSEDVTLAVLRVLPRDFPTFLQFYYADRMLAEASLFNRLKQVEYFYEVSKGGIGRPVTRRIFRDQDGTQKSLGEIVIPKAVYSYVVSDDSSVRDALSKLDLPQAIVARNKTLIDIMVKSKV
jgi:hypothetical protein